MNISLKYIVYFILPLIISTFNTTWAYDMPVGIPDTSIDFEQPAPARPSDWSKEIPGYYYIDMQNGSTSMAFGSETSPRKYWPANPISAGSYIEIKGSLKYSSAYKLIANGTDATWVANTSGPVWITKAKNYSDSSIDSRIILTGENIFVTDLNFNNGGRPQIGSPTTGYDVKNVVVRNNDISAGGVAGIGIAIDRAENAIIYNNKIHDLGDMNSTYDEDAHLMTVGANTSNVWMLDNEGYNASGSGLQVNGNSTTTHNIYVGNNEIYNTRQSGLWVKLAKDVVFSSNYVHDIVSTPWSVSKGMGAQYEPNGFWMINNHIQGAEYGIRIASTTGTAYRQEIYIIGNVIHNIAPIQNTDWIGGPNTWQSAAIHVVGGHDHYIYNNLIFDAPNGIDLSTTFATTDIKNNIIFDLARGQAEGEYGRHIWTEFQHLNDNITINNNYFDNNMKVQIIGNSYNTIEGLKTLGALNNIKDRQFLSGSDIDSIMNNLSASSVDLSIVADKGSNIGFILNAKISAMSSSLSSISRDILHTARTQGTQIDIGPFEQKGSEPATTIPLAPGDIKITPIQ